MKINTPPSYLLDFVVSSDRRTRKKVQKEYGKGTSVFILNFEISRIEMTWNNEYQCQGSVIRCIDLNDNNLILFDASKYGYEGQNEIFESSHNEEFRNITLKSCTKNSEIILDFNIAEMRLNMLKVETLIN